MTKDEIYKQIVDKILTDFPNIEKYELVEDYEDGKYIGINVFVPRNHYRELENYLENNGLEWKTVDDFWVIVRAKVGESHLVSANLGDFVLLEAPYYCPEKECHVAIVTKIIDGKYVVRCISPAFIASQFPDSPFQIECESYCHKQDGFVAVISADKAKEILAHQILKAKNNALAKIERIFEGFELRLDKLIDGLSGNQTKVETVMVQCNNDDIPSDMRG